MNKTETKAFNYLSKVLGKSNIKFQRKDSPDFVLVGEGYGYEVKKLYGHSIWLYNSQFIKLKKSGKCSILVFEGDKDIPTASIPIETVEDGQVINNILIHVIKDSHTIQLEDVVWQTLMMLKIKDKKANLNEVIQELLDKQPQQEAKK